MIVCSIFLTFHSIRDSKLIATNVSVVFARLLVKIIKVFLNFLDSQLLYIVFIFMLSINSNAQEAECGYLTVEKGLKNRTIRKSKTPIIFKVTEELRLQLIFTNSGYPNTLMAELTFEDGSGYPVDLGSILTLHFVDGTHTDLIVSSRKSFTSVAYFTLMKPANKGAKKVMTYEDRLFYEKLIESNIISLEYSIDKKRQKIVVSNYQSEIIKDTVQCLIFN